MHPLYTDQADAVVGLRDDDSNYRLAELVYQHFGIDTMVVRLNDRANFDRFHELGALIVEPTTAIVSLLDHFVRSPAAASLVLGMEANQDVVDLEVRDVRLHGAFLKDIRIPLDSLIVSIHRNGDTLVPHGHTRLRFGDKVTVVGSPESLEQMSVRLER